MQTHIIDCTKCGITFTVDTSKAIEEIDPTCSDCQMEEYYDQQNHSQMLYQASLDDENDRSNTTAQEYAKRLYLKQID